MAKMTIEPGITPSKDTCGRPGGLDRPSYRLSWRTDCLESQTTPVFEGRLCRWLNRKKAWNDVK